MAFFPAKDSIQKGQDQFAGQFHTNDAGSEDNHVHIVVFHPLMGGVMIVTEARTDTVNLIGGDRGTHSASANENAAICAFCQQGLTERIRVVRVIIGNIRILSSEIQYFVFQICQFTGDELLQLVTGMIGRDRNAQVGTS